MAQCRRLKGIQKEIPTPSPLSSLKRRQQTLSPSGSFNPFSHSFLFFIYRHFQLLRRNQNMAMAIPLLLNQPIHRQPLIRGILIAALGVSSKLYTREI
jgi:hypothetical protein